MGYVVLWMSSWSCQYCTLVNSNANSVCAACGATRDTTSKLTSLLPKAVIKPISDVANAIIDVLNDSSASVSKQLNRFLPASTAIRPSSSYPDLPSYFTSPAGSSSSDFIISPDSHSNSLDWICRKCSRANSDSLTFCEQCNERKSIGEAHFVLPLAQFPGVLQGSLLTFCLGLTFQRYRNGPSTSSGYSMPNIYGKMAAGDDMSTLCSEVMAEVERHDRENAAAAYNSIIDMCRQFKTTFIDDGFPHTPKSIGDLHSDDEGAIFGRVPKTFIWLRPEQMYTKDGRAWPWTVFRDPRSSDIEQGCLGDCWLLSAMALIAERPDVLEHILLTKEYSHFGVYQVRLCIDGQWKIVLVDDFFPCRVESRSIAFADGRKNQLWVPLIEKALAKQLGSYARLRAGRTIEGLATLTGAPVEVVSLEDETDKDVRWARILSAREAGFIMGCSCGAGKRHVNPKDFAKNGLLARHAYSILDVVQEKEHRLLRLRNPWGSFVWKGKWSNKWPGWPKDMKQKLLSGEPSTGTFWISYDDFLTHFDAIDIAKIRSYQGWRELRIPVQCGGNFIDSDKAIRILIEEPTEVCFTLFQSGARRVQDQVDLLMCLHMVSPAGTIGELVYRSARKLEAFVSTGDVFLRSGHYIVICHSFTTLGTRKIQGCLAIHSSKPIFADILPCPASMFTDSLVQLVLKEGRIHKSLTGVFPRYVTEDFSGLLLMIDNVLEDMWVHAKVECSNSHNLLSSRGALDVADSIPPLSRQILIILTHFESTQSFAVEHQLIVRVSPYPALADFAIGGGAFRVGTDSHSPSFGCKAIEQLHSRKALFVP
ncbi:Calpain-15 [Trichostrongylus colubriformis]|uniref:Calpain-15 n=1 Tax=Trichostrongylus colubriformis TaxID=6319 RepID=A0AAN8FHC0_TRICO